MSDYNGMPGSVAPQLPPQGGIAAQQANARTGALEEKTDPPAGVQSFAGKSSNKALNAANDAATAQKATAATPAPAQRSNQMQQLTSAPVPQPSSPIVPVGKNESLNLNLTPNTTSGMVKTPDGMTLETSGAPPNNVKIGADIPNPKDGTSIGYGAKTQGDFFQAFKIDPAIGAAAWKSGAESNTSPRPADYVNVQAALDQMGFKYTDSQDAMVQWRSLRNSAAQTSLAEYNNTKGANWGIPITTLSDGSQGRKLYSVSAGIGGNLSQGSPQVEAPPQARDITPPPGPTTSDTTTSDTTVTPPTAQNNGIDLSFLKDMPISDTLNGIGNLIGDYVGQGSRGNLAYAGDFNFRTPQELRQMAQNQRESDIIKNKGLLNNQLEFESAENAIGGPNYQKLTNEQKLQLDKAQQNAREVAGIETIPANRGVDIAKDLARINTSPANSMAAQAQTLGLIQKSEPYALYRTGETIDANSKEGIRSLLAAPLSGVGSNDDKAEQLVTSWLGKSKPNASGGRASVYDANAQDVTNNLINGRKP